MHNLHGAITTATRHGHAILNMYIRLFCPVQSENREGLGRANYDLCRPLGIDGKSIPETLLSTKVNVQKSVFEGSLKQLYCSKSDVGRLGS